MAETSDFLKDLAGDLLGQLDIVTWAEKKFGHTLDPWQKNVLTSEHGKILLNIHRQAGKAVDINTPIPTPSGWKTMGELQPGDAVYDESGVIRVVEWCSPVRERESYRVTFSDRSEIIADGEHLWTVLKGPVPADKDWWREGETFSTTDLERQMAERKFYIPLSPLQGAASGVYILSIEPVGLRQVKCIAVSGPSNLFLCGKAMIPTHNSSMAALLSLYMAEVEPGSLIILLSPTQRQSGELLHTVALINDGAGVAQDSATRIEFENSSRILSLPGSEKTTRGYAGVDLLIIDEASRVDDELYYSVRPMLAVSGGRLIGMSTPFGKRGWFYDEWAKGVGWMREKVTAWECPRITKEFLEEERETLGPLWFAQEYECQFIDATSSVFALDAIDLVFEEEVERWHL